MTTGVEFPPSRKSKIGTWYRMDGAWHLIRTNEMGEVTPGNLIIDKTWPEGSRMRDFLWVLEMWKLNLYTGSLTNVVQIAQFEYLKDAIKYADELFSPFLV
jgi:hypothetical protein